MHDSRSDTLASVREDTMWSISGHSRPCFIPVTPHCENKFCVTECALLF